MASHDETSLSRKHLRSPSRNNAHNTLDLNPKKIKLEEVPQPSSLQSLRASSCSDTVVSDQTASNATSQNLHIRPQSLNAQITVAPGDKERVQALLRQPHQDWCYIHRLSGHFAGPHCIPPPPSRSPGRGSVRWQMGKGQITRLTQSEWPSTIRELMAHLLKLSMALEDFKSFVEQRDRIMSEIDILMISSFAHLNQALRRWRNLMSKCAREMDRLYLEIGQWFLDVRREIVEDPFIARMHRQKVPLLIYQSSYTQAQIADYIQDTEDHDMPLLHIQAFERSTARLADIYRLHYAVQIGLSEITKVFCIDFEEELNARGLMDLVHFPLDCLPTIASTGAKRGRGIHTFDLPNIKELTHRLDKSLGQSNVQAGEETQAELQGMEEGEVHDEDVPRVAENREVIELVYDDE